MRPIYENIDVAIDTSLKVATYNHSKSCESANWHIHPEYELVYIKNGTGTLRIDTKTIPYDDGVLLFLGPNIPHADFGNKEYSSNLEVVIQFRKEFLNEKLAVFPELRKIKKMIQDTKKVFLFDNAVKNDLSLAFEKLGHLNDSQRLIHFISILDELAYTTRYTAVLGENPFNYKATDVTRLENIFEFVNENFDKNISTRTIASQSGLTTNSFCRFFKKMTNQSFVQFLNEFKTRKAVEYFNETQLSISEVMYKCGYNDPSYFAKQFKRHQGVSPSEHLYKAV